jgi:DNA-directed RNA polymerase specialized sigma24 family protein
VTDEARAMQSADDAELLNRVRTGDTEAFQVLCQRHEQAARLLARDLVATVAELDDLVAETFAQVLEVTRRGGGPADAFRPYVLTALRRVWNDRLTQSQMTAGDDQPGGSLANPGEPAIDPAAASLDESVIVRAFLSLPERWIAVLWHIEIEGASPAEVAPLFGLSRNGVAGLRRQAKDGLRQAYLQMYTSGIGRPECTAVAVRLGAFIRDAVPGPDSAMVTEHLSQCDDCRAVFAELSDVSIPLRAMVAPVVLGGSADYYLSGPTPNGQARTVPAFAAGAKARATAAATAGAVGRLRPRVLARDTARPRRWLAVGGAAVVAAGAIAFAISLAGHGTPLKPAGRNQALAPASLQAPPTVGQPSATPARSITAPAVVRASVGRNTPAGAAASPQGSTSPARPPGRSPAPGKSLASGGGTSCTTTATSDISADCYSASQGTIDVTPATGDTNPSGVDGNQVAQLTNGDYLEYTGINFGSGSSQFDAQVASGAADGVSGLVEVVLDNPANSPVGSFAVGNTGGWSSWKSIPANITTVTGTHNVYLEFVSAATGNPPFVSLHYFSFPTT